MGRFAVSNSNMLHVKDKKPKTYTEPKRQEENKENNPSNFAMEKPQFNNKNESSKESLTLVPITNFFSRNISLKRYNNQVCFIIS